MNRTKWLDEIVCWNGSEYIPRYTAVWRFVSKGLHPFLSKNGYTIYHDVKNLSTSLCTMLYVNRGLSCLDRGTLLIPTLEEEEHKWQYYHVLSQTKWDELWSKWSLWSDLTDDRGGDRKIDIQEYCWSQLNLDESPQTRVVEEMMQEDEERLGRTEDVYLREIAEFDTGKYR